MENDPLMTSLFDANVINAIVGLVDRRYDKSTESWKLQT